MTDNKAVRTGAGWGITNSREAAIENEFQRQWEREKARLAEKDAKARAKRRVPCGAKTRKGHPCKALSEPARRRCRFHGGKSTGPRTQAGKERIAAAQRLRWKRYREAQS